MSTPSLTAAARAMKALTPLLSALKTPAKDLALLNLAQALRENAQAIA